MFPVSTHKSICSAVLGLLAPELRQLYALDGGGGASVRSFFTAFSVFSAVLPANLQIDDAQFAIRMPIGDRWTKLQLYTQRWRVHGCMADVSSECVLLVEDRIANFFLQFVYLKVSLGLGLIFAEIQTELTIGDENRRENFCNSDSQCSEF